MKRGSSSFKPKARILKLLGEELITNEVIAIVELVKNSYDADATQVEVILENITDPEEGRISVCDNGTGMDLDRVLNVWLQPGTFIKKNAREKGELSKELNRHILGEKGVGRFAAQKIGSLITLITKTAISNYESLVEIDWKEYEEDKFLSDVEVNWIQVEPKEYKGSKHGTKIIISFLKKPWTKSMAYKLATELASLQSPFREKDNFKITLISNDFPKINDAAQFPKNVFEKAVYSFSGKIDSSGLLKDAEYKFNYPKFSEFNRTVPISERDIRDADFFKENDKMIAPKCGEFKFKFYVWDLDPMSLSETITRSTYNQYIKPQTGIRVFRDVFRVWPYGDKENDWLGLNPRRVNNPPKCLSNNQIVGLIDITSDKNPKLIDKTDREGLIENIEYKHFQNLVLSAINQLEIFRRQDKTKVDELRERKTGKSVDQTTEEVAKLEKKLKVNNHLPIYEKNIDSIKKAHTKYKTEIVDKLYIAAGIGTAALMPAHEIQIQLKDLEPTLRNLKENLIKWGFGSRVVQTFEDIDEILSSLWEVSDGALELVKRNVSTFSLVKAVNFSIKVKHQALIRNKIELEFSEDYDVKIKGYSNFIITALLNLLDNSIYWLKHKKENRKIRITIKKNNDESPVIIVSDNGPGIHTEDIPFLGSAFYTRKPSGSGLGLYICKRCMEVHDGKIDIGFLSEDPDFLEGANVSLIFGQKREVK